MQHAGVVPGHQELDLATGGRGRHEIDVDQLGAQIRRTGAELRHAIG